MKTTGARVTETQAATIELEVRIEAPADRVWRAMVDEPNAWWVPEMRVLSGNEEVVLEPCAGGRLYERGAGGGELLWFTVLAIEPEKSMILAGHVVPPFGGPATAYLRLDLEEHGAATVLRITNSLVGVVDEQSLPSIDSGWRLLFEGGLKTLVEKGAGTE